MRTKLVIVAVILLGMVTTVQAIDYGGIRSGETKFGEISTPGQMDSFAFYGKVGQDIFVEMTDNGNDLGPAIDLYNSSGLELQAVGGYNENRVIIWKYKLKKTGLYTIVTRSSGAGYTSLTGKYGISLFLNNGPTSSKQDLNGGSIKSGQVINGTIDIADTDAYTFYGNKDNVVTVEMSDIGTDLGPRIFLYNYSGLETWTSAGYNENRIRLENYKLKNTGLYTILVDASWAGYTSPSGKYGLSLVKIPSALPTGIYNPYPTDKSKITNFKQSFKWDAVSGATGYDLYFGEDVTTPLKKIGSNLKNPEMQFSSLSPNKIYYWHVEAITPSRMIKGPYWWFNTGMPIGCNPTKIYGYKFNDANGNKTKDVGEVGISGWTINLKGFDTCTKTIVSLTARTNSTGYYSFTGVNSGAYIVYENFVLNFLPTTDAAYTLRVPSASTSIKKNFGNKK